MRLSDFLTDTSVNQAQNIEKAVLPMIKKGIRLTDFISGNIEQSLPVAAKEAVDTVTLPFQRPEKVVSSPIGRG